MVAVMRRALPWLLSLVALAGGAAIGWRLASARDAEAEARRTAEAREIEAADLAVAARVEADVAAADARRMASESAALAAELEQLRAVAGKVKIVRVAEGSTGPVVVTADPASPSAPGETPCLVRPGDRLELRVRDVEAHTRAGNIVLIGSAQAVRLDPELVLVDAPLRYSLAERVPEPAPSGWPWWSVVVSAAGGVIVGAVVAR